MNTNRSVAGYEKLLLYWTPGCTRRSAAHLTVTLERLIVEESVGFFYVGQYGSFDRLAGLAVKQLKQHYPFITLMLVLPYHPADRPIPTPPVLMELIIRRVWKTYRKDMLSLKPISRW